MAGPTTNASGTTPVANTAPGHAVQQQYCVRWNSYQTNLQNAFPKLLLSESFVDVTLACEHDMIKCHKVVLSASSSYFEKLLVKTPCTHPIIFLKDMKFSELQALVEFMYKGEVNVNKEDLPSLLKSAEALQIRGLYGSNKLYLDQQQQQQEPSTTEVQSQPEDNIKAESVEMQPMETVEQNAQELFELIEKDLPDDGDERELKIDEDLDDAEGVDAAGDEDDDEEMEAASAMAKVSCQYQDSGSAFSLSMMSDSGGGRGSGIGGENVSGQSYGASGEYLMMSSKRIRRSDAELRRAAECITRGQTFQMVSDKFRIPISTIRFYMARKGILPRRKRGRACSVPNSLTISATDSNISRATFRSTSGNSSPLGPPFHILNYKLPIIDNDFK